MTVKFWTPGAIPLTSFTLMGANVKLGSSPIGQFGTGLKYAVAVIMRHGGKIRMTIEGVEYEFIRSKRVHRGKEFDVMRMRQRHGTLARWVNSRELPFTLSYGRNWELWQAYRELESNTRDEDGKTVLDGGDVPEGGSVIEVDCPGFEDAVASSEAFFDPEGEQMLYSGPMVSIYARPSKYLYYRGIRVYTLRYPARLTYDFNYPHVILTEDRTAANSWSMMYNLAKIVQNEIEDVGTLKRMFHVSERSDNALSFETMELNFDVDELGSEVFRSTVRALTSTGAGGRSVNSYWAAAQTPVPNRSSVALADADWDSLLDLTDKILGGSPLNNRDLQRLEEVTDKIKGELE